MWSAEIMRCSLTSAQYNTIRGSPACCCRYSQSERVDVVRGGSAASGNYGNDGDGGDSAKSAADNFTMVSLFDCAWELRVYAPLGGVSGQLSFVSEGDVSVNGGDLAVQEDFVDATVTHNDQGAVTTIQFDACANTVDDVVGEVRVCEANPSARGFNRSAFASASLAADFDAVVQQHLLHEFVRVGASTNASVAMYGAAVSVLAVAFREDEGSGPLYGAPSNTSTATMAATAAECMTLRVHAVGNDSAARAWAKTSFSNAAGASSSSSLSLIHI